MSKRKPYAESGAIINTDTFGFSYGVRVFKAGAKPMWCISDGKLVEYGTVAEADAKAREITKVLRSREVTQ